MSLGMSLDSFERHVQPELRLIRRGKLRLVPVAELERCANESAESVFRPAAGVASVAVATGIRTRHARSCRSHEGGRCNCTPSYQAQAYDMRTRRQVWRTFPTLSAAKLWRQDAQVALRRGTMRPPTAKTIAEAAEVLIAGAHDGTILDRGGKAYKPSTARGTSSSSAPTWSRRSAATSSRRSIDATSRTSSTTFASRACPPRP
jgi:hypothetical protein